MTGTATMAEIEVAAISAGDNDRREFDPTKLEELAASIDKLGLAEPIVVVPAGDGTYRLVAGERRWRAHQLLGRATIAATIRTDIDAQVEAGLMLAENTSRVDLSMMEEARAYAKRVDAGLSIDEIAEQAGVAAFRVQWRLDLLTLCDAAQEAVEAGVLPAGPALELRKLDVERQMIGLKAWMANPAMGHFEFRKLCDQLGKAEPDPMGGLFDPGEWEEKARKMKPGRMSTKAMRSLIFRMADELRAFGYDGDLLAEAETMRLQGTLK